MSTPSYSERLRRAIQSIAGDDTSTSILDAAVHAVGESMSRWTSEGGLSRFLGDLGNDTLTRTGEFIELSAKLTMVGALGARANFFLSSKPVAEAVIDPDGNVRSMIRAPEPGVYRVELEVVSTSGAVIVSRGSTGHSLLHVVEHEAVALIDASLVLSGAVTAAPLRKLEDAGFVIAYFDIDLSNRSIAIRDALKTQQLPQAAILIYAAEEQHLDPFGVDFTEMFAVTALRRLRSKGVFVTMLVTEADVPKERTERFGLYVMTPDDVLADADTVDVAHRAATTLAEAHASTAPCTWRLDEATASKVVLGNRFHAELDNRAARRRLFELIEAAQRTIHIQLFILEPGRFAEHLIVRLIERARKGVTVRLMVDALYSGQNVLGRDNPLVVALREEPHAEVLAITPIDTRGELSASKLKRRDHRKLVIIDSTIAFVSGRNGGDAYYFGFDETPVHDQTPHERIPWFDAHVEIEGPLVRRIQETFVETWHAESGPEVPTDPTADFATAGDAGGRLVVHRSLTDANGLGLYEAMLDVAEHHAYVVNDFPFAPPLEQAVRRAVARGVRVRLLTGNAVARRADGTFFQGPLYRELFEYMVKSRLEPLLAIGVEVFELVPPASRLNVARGGQIRPYVHAKIVSIDGRLASIGSANLDVTASFWEDEANVVVENDTFAQDLEAQLGALIKGSLRIDENTDYWARERTQRAVVDRLWPQSMYS